MIPVTALRDKKPLIKSAKNLSNGQNLIQNESKNSKFLFE